MSQDWRTRATQISAQPGAVAFHPPSSGQQSIEDPGGTTVPAVAVTRGSLAKSAPESPQQSSRSVAGSAPNSGSSKAKTKKAALPASLESRSNEVLSEETSARAVDDEEVGDDSSAEPPPAEVDGDSSTGQELATLSANALSGDQGADGEQSKQSSPAADNAVPLLASISALAASGDGVKQQQTPKPLNSD